MPIVARLDPETTAQLAAVAAALHETAAQFAQQIADAQRRQDQAAQSIGGVRVSGALPATLTGTPAVSQAVTSSPGVLAGYSLRETSGTTAAVVRLRDGADASGALLATISLAPAESARDWFLPSGIGFAFGVYVEVVSGAVEGVCWLGAAR